MKHKNIQKKLLRYIDAELPENERQEIETHLKQCEQCRKDVELLSGTWYLSQQVKVAHPSPFLWEKISNRLDVETQKNYLIYRAASFIREMAQPALTAAAVILALFIGIQIGGHLVTDKLSSQQNAITTNQLQSEFGMDNFQLFSTSSIGSELSALMDYKNE